MQCVGIDAEIGVFRAGYTEDLTADKPTPLQASSWLALFSLSVGALLLLRRRRTAARTVEGVTVSRGVRPTRAQAAISAGRGCAKRDSTSPGRALGSSICSFPFARSLLQ